MQDRQLVCYKNMEKYNHINPSEITPDEAIESELYEFLEEQTRDDLEITPKQPSKELELTQTPQETIEHNDVAEHERPILKERDFIVPEKSTDELIGNAVLKKLIDDLSRIAEEKGDISVTLGDSKLDISRENDAPKIKVNDKEVTPEQLREFIAKNPQAQTIQKDYIDAVKEELSRQKESKRREDKIVEHSYRKDKLKGIESRINSRKEGMGTERLGEKIKQEESRLNEELQR